MNQAERHHVVDDICSSSHILLPEKNGGNCSAAGGNQRAEGHYKIHQRQRNGKSGDCHGAHSPSDEYTVDDVVDADGDTRDDGRNGILHKELANRERAECCGIRLPRSIDRGGLCGIIWIRHICFIETSAKRFAVNFYNANLATFGDSLVLKYDIFRKNSLYSQHEGNNRNYAKYDTPSV